MILEISRLAIGIDSPYEVTQTVNFKGFIKGNKKPDYIVELIPTENLLFAMEDVVHSDVDYCVCRKKEQFLRYYFHPRCQGVIYAKSCWDWKEKRITVEYLPQYQEFLSESGNALFHIGLEQIMLREQRLIFHSACVETIHGGILFTGPAGAGKSTQADLWIKHRDAFLINGDRPILSVDENGWKAWGSPYAGSSRCYVNKCCNVKAIVRVVQDSENKVVRLKGSRAFSTVFSGVTVNDWSREDVCMASELVIQLINAIPVYEMHCTKTEEAIEILETVLKGEMN